MRKVSFKRFEVSSVHGQVLKEAVISEGSPGTILKDFDTVLDYLRKQELPVAGRHQLPRNVMAEMNARLTHPIQLRLKRPQQKSYPHLHGLYLRENKLQPIVSEKGVYSTQSFAGPLNSSRA